MSDAEMGLRCGVKSSWTSDLTERVYSHFMRAELKVSDVARFDSGCTLEGNDMMETACIKMGSGK
eukprot:4606186-Amphidinium_carterae.1